MLNLALNKVDYPCVIIALNANLSTKSANLVLEQVIIKPKLQAMLKLKYQMLKLGLTLQHLRLKH